MSETGAQLQQRVESFLKTLLEATQLDLEAVCEVEDQVVVVQLSGNDAPMVLEDQARLLYAINHLLNRAFYERSTEGCSFIVDCNQYRAARADELREVARGAAERVKQSGSLVVLEPMPASERRIVHLALAEEAGIATESEGTGTYRRVVVLPAKLSLG